MTVYILDGLRQKEGALGAAWLTLALALIAGAAGDLLLTSPLPTELAAASFLVAAATLFLTGVCWALPWPLPNAGPGSPGGMQACIPRACCIPDSSRCLRILPPTPCPPPGPLGHAQACG